MRKLRSFPAKLIIIFSIVLLLVGGTGIFALLWFNKTSANYDVERNNAFELIVMSERLRADMERTIASARGYFLTGDEAFLARVREAETDVDRELHNLQLKAITVEDNRLLDKINETIENYQHSLNELIIAKNSNVNLETIANRFESEMSSQRKILDRAIDDFQNYRQARHAAAIDETRKGERSALEIGLSTVIASVFAAAVISWWVTKQLVSTYERLKVAEYQARAAVAAREELLATVAHDLRNPLNAISMKSSLINKSTNLDKAHEQAASIGNVSMRMEYLIGSLLDMASFETGNLNLQKIKFELNEMLNEMIGIFNDLAIQKSIRIESIRVEKPLEVIADKDRTLEVLSNLLGNALKFTSEGGSVSLSAKREDDKALISISDTGPGIANENVPRLFDRFWQADKGRPRGTGLGLYISKKIVEAHGCRIWVETVLGRGATFYFTLPTTELI